MAFDDLLRQYPTIAYLREAARRNVPRFAFDFVDSGAGNDLGIERNWQAFDALGFVPRYGLSSGVPQTDVSLFGKTYAAPVGMAPVGGLSIIWAGAEKLMAAAAQAANTPYVMAVAGGLSVEDAIKIAPDVLWMQTYRFAKNEHVIAWDLLDRAAAVGVDVLVLTMDVPGRTTRSREARSGLNAGFKPSPAMLWEIATHPRWLMEVAREGQPRFSMLQKYLPPGASANEVVKFSKREIGGGVTWDEVARHRDRWKGKLVLKGILHPEDALKAEALGVDGIWVSNHGGRQIEGLVPAIDALPGIAMAVSDRTTVLVDSGVRSGSDVARGLALGADAVFAGKAFGWSLGAVGREGPAYALELLRRELRECMMQLGINRLSELAGVPLRRQ